MFLPPPRRAASPRGRYPIDTLPGGRQPLCRRRDHPHRNPVSTPWHCIRSIAMHCPPPIEGAGGGRGSGREAGVDPEVKTPPQETRATGAGAVHPPSPSAPPRGRFSIDTVSGRNATCVPVDPSRQVVGETSALYGIPEECVEEVVAAVPT